MEGVVKRRALVPEADAPPSCEWLSSEVAFLIDAIAAGNIDLLKTAADRLIMTLLRGNPAKANLVSSRQISATSTRTAHPAFKEKDLRFKMNRTRDQFVAMGQIVALSFLYLPRINAETSVERLGCALYNKLFGIGVTVLNQRVALCADDNTVAMEWLRVHVYQVFPEVEQRQDIWFISYRRLLNVFVDSIATISKGAALTHGLGDFIVDARQQCVVEAMQHGMVLATPLSQLAPINANPAVPLSGSVPDPMAGPAAAIGGLQFCDLDDDFFQCLGEYLARHDALTLATFTLTSKSVCRVIKHGLRYLDTASLNIPAKLQAMFAVGFPNLQTLRIACVPPNIVGCLLWKLPMLESLTLTAVPVTKPFEKEMFSEVLKRLCPGREIASASLKKLTLTCAIATVPYLLELEVQCPNVEEFAISELSQSASLFSEQVVQLCRMWPRLRVLQIPRCALSRDAMLALSQKSGLQVLNISDAVAQNGEVLGLLGKGVLRTTLSELYMNKMCNLNDSCLRVLLSSGLAQLQTLHLSALKGVGDEGLSAVTYVGSTLTSLNITGEIAFSAECLNNVIVSCPKLKTFIAGPNKNMCDDTLLALANSCRDLRVLKLRQCQACSKSIGALRLNCLKLQELALTENNKLTDASLRCLPPLQWLDISSPGGRISPVGICEYLKQNGRLLRYLDLTHIQATDSDAVLCTVGSSCVYLHTLRVHSEWLTAPALIALSQLCYLSKLEVSMTSKQRSLMREPQVPFGNHPPVSLSDASRMWQRYLTECDLYQKSKVLPTLKFDLSGNCNQQAQKEFVARSIADRLRYQEFLASSVQAERLNAGASLIDDYGVYDTSMLVKEMEGKSQAQKLYCMAVRGAACVDEAPTTAIQDLF
eukprot:TRINITY_DN10102_c0_g1_i1.p1 TRINITY_DN10102_c0_g1~~TRINITY_DN10102_c0_g1_i1.p1  ORF type:complete len:964 (-),score=200.87 TRINITY_DN10102_c0_g1_i1:1036-3666(-)